MSGPVQESTVRSVDVKLGSGRRTLRISRIEVDDSEDTIIFASGFGGIDVEGVDSFNRPHWLDGPVRIPANAIPGVLDALRSLLEAS